MTEGKTAPPANARRATWYALSGIVFIMTGLFAYLQVSIPSVGAILLVIAGVAVILLGLFRYHPTPDALAVFLVSLLVFALVVSTPYFFAQGRTYSFTRAQHPAVSKLSLSVSESFGSINVHFIDDPNLIANLTYGRSGFPFAGFFESTVAPTVTNSSVSNTLLVSGSAGAASLDVAIGSIKVTSLNVSTSTGSIMIDATNSPNLSGLSAQTSTGSVSIVINTSTLTTLRASASTGSVDVTVLYHTLPSNGSMTVTTQTGSAALRLTLEPGVGCDLSASTNFGSVHPSLSGFQNPIVQTNTQLHVRSQNYGLVSHYLLADVTTSTGSVSVNAQAIT